MLKICTRVIYNAALGVNSTALVLIAIESCSYSDIETQNKTAVQNGFDAWLEALESSALLDTFTPIRLDLLKLD